MTLEFLVMGHNFDNCYDAMQFIIKRRTKLKEKQQKHEHVWQSDWLQVVDSFLALGEQCKRQPTKNFEHYPRLTNEWALEILNQVFSVDSAPLNFTHTREWLTQCNQNYINDFDLMEYIHEYN